MNSKTKRLFFFSLLFAYIGYTFLVDTVGTEQDKGKAYMTAEAKVGKLLFQKYNCTACHQLYGLGGYMGPDLTNEMSAPGKGPLYARAFLEHGTNKMPDFHMSNKEINDLIAFLQYVDKTGISPVKKFKTNWDGTVDINPSQDRMNTSKETSDNTSNMTGHRK